MRRSPGINYKPRATIDEQAAREMHRLGEAYAELALYWLSTGSVSWTIARTAYEVASNIHTLALLIEQETRDRTATSSPSPQRDPAGPCITDQGSPRAGFPKPSG